MPRIGERRFTFSEAMSITKRYFTSFFNMRHRGFIDRLDGDQLYVSAPRSAHEVEHLLRLAVDHRRRFRRRSHQRHRAISLDQIEVAIFAPHQAEILSADATNKLKPRLCQQLQKRGRPQLSHWRLRRLRGLFRLRRSFAVRDLEGQLAVLGVDQYVIAVKHLAVEDHHRQGVLD